MIKIISNQPPKGMADWLPEEMSIRQYIFNTWRATALKFGYREYLTPMVEAAEIYRAKSGEDVGGAELMTFTDRAGRELAIRPEMTPSVTRLVSKIYDSSPKPLRLFSIANFLRNEKPQRGRNREFWQLNYDIFGATTLAADIEVMQLGLEIIKAFKPPKNSFKLFINHRQLLDFILDKIVKAKAQDKIAVVRILDKWQKLPATELTRRLQELGLTVGQIKIINDWLSVKNLAQLVKAMPACKSSIGYQELAQAIDSLASLGYKDLVEFNPAIIRGFDYYDGLVFEVFDLHPDNNRAMFGGGRYNGLAGIFGAKPFPAVGCAPGDEPTRLFLDSWGLVKKIMADHQPTICYLPLLSNKLMLETQKLAAKLRAQNYNIESGFNVEPISKALQYANKQGISQVIILGEDEMKKQVYKIKDMETGKEKEISD